LDLSPDVGRIGVFRHSLDLFAGAGNLRGGTHKTIFNTGICARGGKKEEQNGENIMFHGGEKRDIKSIPEKG